jgi:hypothetical protein
MHLSMRKLIETSYHVHHIPYFQQLQLICVFGAASLQQHCLQIDLICVFGAASLQRHCLQIDLICVFGGAFLECQTSTGYSVFILGMSPRIQMSTAHIHTLGPGGGSMGVMFTELYFILGVSSIFIVCASVLGFVASALIECCLVQSRFECFLQLANIAVSSRDSRSCFVAAAPSLAVAGLAEPHPDRSAQVPLVKPRHGRVVRFRGCRVSGRAPGLGTQCFFGLGVRQEAPSAPSGCAVHPPRQTPA